MTKNIVTCGLLLFSFLAFSQAAQAEIVVGLDVSPDPFAASTSGTITGFVDVTGGDASTQFGGYAWGIQVAAIGGADINDFSVTSASAGEIGSTTLDDTSFAPDLVISGVGPPVTAGADNRVNLFTLNFDIAAGATELGGFTFDVTTLQGNDPQLTDNTGAPIAFTFDGIEGRANFAAVPEPGSLAVVCLFGGLMVTRRRRNSATC